MMPLNYDDWEPETCIRMTGCVNRIPTPSAIVRSVRPGVVTPAPVKARRVQTPTVATFRTRAAKKAMWPVFLCGFIAGIFGGVAFFKSPVGKKPAVQHVMKQAKHAMLGR
jgi:hypothetical protein